MLPLAELKPGQAVCGLEPSAVVSVVAVVPIAAGTVQVVYRLPDGSMRERLLNAGDEAGIALATATRPWAFDGDGAAFQLACEAKRIDLAFLFDPMMAMHTSNVEPLPHQITAVYESMLPRQPLRDVLADDPGAGKTIMAGLYTRELVTRADARRVLVVAPGGLVEQWRDELHDKFGLDFRVFSPQLEQASPGGNPFEHHPRLIVRLDQMARNEDLQAKLCAAGWDLVVFDEAHKLAAHFYGTKVETTGRYRFARRIGRETRHLLLMTATPHSGKEADFQLFLGLLDSDRFSGKFRDGVHKTDVSDLMRRMVKEEPVKFDGTPLFPERKAYTVNYALPPPPSWPVAATGPTAGPGGRTVGDDTTEPAPERLAEMQQVVDRARRGDESAVPRLRELLAEFPALGDYYGDAARHALGVWIRVAAGSDLHLRESLCVKVDSPRRGLAGESPGPILTLLVDRVVQSWLAANFFAGTEGTAIGAAEGPKMLAFRAKRRLQAERAHLAALALLAAVGRHRPRPSPVVAAGDAGRTPPTPGGPADAANRLADYFEQLSRRPAAERGQAAAARN